MRAYVTDDYHLVVGEKDDMSVYHVINKDSKVVEYEDYLLPRTLDTMLEMQSRLKEQVRKFDFPTVATVGEDDGAVNVH